MSIEFEFIFSGLSALEVEGKLRQIIDTALVQKYGDTPDEVIAKRITEEWAAMERTNVIHDVAALYELAVWLKKNRHPYWLRGCAGSSFILYLLGITTGNPLPSHYYCPICKSVQWQSLYADGFDLPQDVTCANDDALLISDGHGIAWQIFFGFGDFSPVFDIDLPSDLYENVRGEWASHWLKTIDPCNVPANPYEGKRQCIKISKLSLMFHLDRDEISHTFYNHEYTAADREYMLLEWNLLINNEANFTNDIPEPDRVADLISLFGLSYSAGAWDEATACMIEEMGYSPADMIAYRDDVYGYLIDHGFLEKDAWRGMNRVRKGLDFPVITDEMRQARDKWVLSRCERIGYLSPKSHAVEYMFFTLKSLF